jgi:hypothetical protein
MLGRLGSDRWKSGGSRTNVTIGAIRLLKYGITKYHCGAKRVIHASFSTLFLRFAPRISEASPQTDQWESRGEGLA